MTTLELAQQSERKKELLAEMERNPPDAITDIFIGMRDVFDEMTQDAGLVLDNRQYFHPLTHVAIRGGEGDNRPDSIGISLMVKTCVIKEEAVFFAVIDVFVDGWHVEETEIHIGMAYLDGHVFVVRDYLGEQMAGFKSTLTGLIKLISWESKGF